MRHSMPNPRTTRPAWCAAMVGLMATLATATAATARPVTAYVVNYADDTVTPIDLATGTPGATIPVGSGPTAIAITPDASKAYVANRGNYVHSVTGPGRASRGAASRRPI